MDLNGKTAVITGISHGIGRATAIQLLNQGTTVIGWGLTEPDYQHPLLHFVQTDIRDFQQVQNAAHYTLQTVGTPDFLINNAGVGYFVDIDHTSLQQWHEMFDVNVHGVFYCLKTLLPSMKRRGQGHVVNISSIAGLTGIPQMSAYCATKFAITGLSDALFKELRQYGIKVTCVHPGSVKTSFFNRIPHVDPADYMMHPEEVAQQIVRALQTSDNFLINTIVFRPLKTE